MSLWFRGCLRSPLGDCPLWGVLGSLTLFLKRLGKPEMPSYLVSQSYSGSTSHTGPLPYRGFLFGPCYLLNCINDRISFLFLGFLIGRERGDLGVISPSGLSEPHVSPAAASLPNPCPSSLSPLMGDGDSVGCPGGIRESLGGPNCGP